MEESIVDYIRQNIEKGYSSDQVRESLLSQGYSPEEVDSAFSSVSLPEGQPQPAGPVEAAASGDAAAPPSAEQQPDSITKSDSYFLKLTGILFHPLKVLEELKEEKGIGKPMKFFLFSWFLAAILTGIVDVLFGDSLVSTVLFSLAVVVIGISAELFFAGVTHVLVRIFGGKEPFYQTFKAFAYMSAFSMVAMFISGLAKFIPLVKLANGALSLWTLVLFYSCFRLYTGVKGWRLVALFIIYFMLVVLTIITVSTFIFFWILALIAG